MSMDDIDPSMNQGTLITLVFGSIIIAAIGIFIVVIILNAGSTFYVDTFTVTDITVDRDCGLVEAPDNDFLVEYQNSTGYRTLTTAEYTVSGRVVTVLAAAMD